MIPNDQDAQNTSNKENLQDTYYSKHTEAPIFQQQKLRAARAHSFINAKTPVANISSNEILKCSLVIDDEFAKNNKQNNTLILDESGASKR